MQKVKVSVVSYLNSKPFIYGLENSDLIHEIDLQQDIPSVCAQKLLTQKVDIGLIPVAIIPSLAEHYIISDYCIGAVGKVASVCLYSNVPLNKIKTVLLDYQSRTSVTLVKVLAAELWNIQPEWKKADEQFEKSIKDDTAAVIIGDRTFGLENTYAYSYDLAEEWQKLTGLPFVFACWVANKKQQNDFISKFNCALKNGINHISHISESLQKTKKYSINVENYLSNNISYTLDEPKKEALALFLKYLKKMK
jgi:chorismate dehydratase